MQYAVVIVKQVTACTQLQYAVVLSKASKLVTQVNCTAAPPARSCSVLFVLVKQAKLVVEPPVATDAGAGGGRGRLHRRRAAAACFCTSLLALLVVEPPVAPPAY
jgi:hypothetical protein